jgi:hypothetical protein
LAHDVGLLLQAGAEPDVPADMYGVECTTMTLLVSSSHPADAGLQVPLIELLLSFGAAIEGRGTRRWGGPLFTALAVGMSDAIREQFRPKSWTPKPSGCARAFRWPRHRRRQPPSRRSSTAIEKTPAPCVSTTGSPVPSFGHSLIA